MKTPDPNTPKRKPPRAEPLQQDRPGAGRQRQPEGDAADAEARREENSVKRAKEQSSDAIDNTREGYR